LQGARRAPMIEGGMAGIGTSDETVDAELERIRDRSAKALIAAVLLFAVPVLIANNVERPSVHLLGSGLLLVLGLVGALAAIGRGHGRAPRTVTVAMLGAAMAYRAWVLGGLAAIPYHAWTVHVLIAGLLLGRRAAAISAAVGILLGAWFVVAEQRGLLPTSEGLDSLWVAWFLRVALLVVTLLLVSALLRGVQSALSRLNESERQRRRQDERYQLAALGASFGTWDLDVANALLWLGPGVQRMVGLPRGAAVVSQVSWRDRMHADDRERCEASLRRHIEGREPQFEAEYRVRHADGSYLWVQARGRLAPGPTVRVVGFFQDISERKAAERELKHRAFHDPLTGLPNRELFLERLGRALIEGHRKGAAEFAVVFVDLDRFKVVNDSLGHAAGDRLLGVLADRLNGAVRAPDTVARLGGDEFTVLLRGPATIEEAKIAVARIERAVAEPFELAGQEVVVGASIGILMGSLDYQDAEELLRVADLAMYSVKGEGAGRVGVFDPAMRGRMRAMLALDSALRRALDGGELEPWYQPIVDLSDNRIVGVEALARWRQEDGTVVPPEAFIPRAEETGVVAEIDRQIIERAAHTVAAWNEDGPPLYLSVNLSARQFQRKGLAAFVDGVLERSGLPGNLLQIEITEGILLLDAPGIRQTLTELRQRGARISFDDFGTGYSSLSYLHRFDIEHLKIDRAFVQERGERGPGPICRAIQSMAGALGIQTTGEGVETEAQAEGLRILGCGTAQGYLFGRPAPYVEGRPDQVGSTS
jgi:diguanylate cyclase (GGDEF)-like protein/PAS domain S-box-containing protein